jgi:hypothetical protein
MSMAGTQHKGAGARRPSLAKLAGWAALLAWSVVASLAHADSVLVSDTSLVSGSQSTVFAFQAPGAGTVTAEVTNVDWPQLLSSLSFVATSANQTMTSWSDPATQTSATLSFQVMGSGNYFADITASAGGPLDLGVYSLMITFTPAASPVPLPAAGWLLLSGALALVAWLRLRRPAGSWLLLAVILDLLDWLRPTTAEPAMVGGPSPAAA